MPRPAPTRRDVGAAAAGPLLRLPAPLAQRFAVIKLLPHQGVEADLLHVRGDTGAELVAKVYRSGFTIDPQVGSKLARIRTRHVVRVHESGQADGHDWELLEYIAGGNLGDLGGPLVADEIVVVVQQLTEALQALHGSGIVHRDLKPENVLVRSRVPLELALGDFGLSRYLETTMAFASASRTLAYSAPESLSNHMSPARDWWSLGMIVRQLATGRRPFDGLDEAVVLHHLSVRPIDLSGVGDDRTRLLCRGLLVRDPERRWGWAQVREWLGGGRPPVTEAASAGRPLQFGGRLHTDRRELAHTLAKDWGTAARRFFGTGRPRGGTTEGWRVLRAWLSQFDDPAHHDVEGLVELIDTHLSGDYSADVKLLYLLRWLDPAMRPVYRGERLLPEDLRSLSARAAGPREPQHEFARVLVEDLWSDRLFSVLHHFADGTELTEVDQRWRELVGRWPPPDGPPTVRRALAAAPAREVLLAAAAEPGQTLALFRERARKAAASLQGHLPWFDRMVGSAGNDPVRLLAVALAAPHARAEVEWAERQQRLAADEAARQRAERERREVERLDARGQALGLAALGCAIALVPWVIGAGLALESAGVTGPGESVLLGTALIPVAGELWLARELAGDYHPRWSLLGAMQAAARWAGPRMQAQTSRLARLSTVGGLRAAEEPCGCACLGCLGLFVLYAILWLVAVVVAWASPVLTAITAPAYGFWVWRRLRSWREGRAPGGAGMGDP